MKGICLFKTVWFEFFLTKKVTMHPFNSGQVLQLLFLYTLSIVLWEKLKSFEHPLPSHSPILISLWENRIGSRLEMQRNGSVYAKDVENYTTEMQKEQIYYYYLSHQNKAASQTMELYILTRSPTVISKIDLGPKS